MPPDEIRLINMELRLINSKLDAILGLIQDQTEIRIIDGAQNALTHSSTEEKFDKMAEYCGHINNRLDDEVQDMKKIYFSQYQMDGKIKGIDKKIDDLSEQLSKIKAIVLPRA
jgi:hypothetical protein